MPRNNAFERSVMPHRRRAASAARHHAPAALSSGVGHCNQLPSAAGGFRQ